MNRCEAPNCKMRTYAPTPEQLKMANDNYVISFHRFPDEPEKRQSWISAAKKPLWRPPMFNSSLCSLHFRDDCFDENNELYDYAVPSIFFDDFGSYLRELVKKLDLECKLDDDSPLKASRGSDNPANTSIESNRNSLLPESDDYDVDFVECEEVFVYDENSKLGIENISIQESDGIASDVVESGSDKISVPATKVDDLKSDSNSVADVRISNSTEKNSRKNTSESIWNYANVCTPVVDSLGNSTKSNALPFNTTSSSLPTMAPSIKPSSDISIKLNIEQPNTESLSSKPTTFKPNAPKPSITSSNVTKSSNSSPEIIPASTSPTVVDEQPKSTFTLHQSKKSVNNASEIPDTSEPITTSIVPESFTDMEPSTKTLVLQLLNIVKMASTMEESKGGVGPTINSYLVTSKGLDITSSVPSEILSSSKIIGRVADYIKAIKEEKFIKPNNVTIICGNPAIFLLKNVTIEECDPNMNCVYVVTSENLLPHFCTLKLKSDLSENSVRQQLAQMILPNNDATGQTAPSTLNNAVKKNTVTKSVDVSSPTNELSNTIPSSSPGVLSQTSSSISNPSATKPSAKKPISKSTRNKTRAKNSPSYSSKDDFEHAEPQANNSIVNVTVIESTDSGSILDIAMPKSTASGSTLNATLTKSTATGLISNATRSKSKVSSSSVNTGPPKSTARKSISNAKLTSSKVNNSNCTIPAKSTCSTPNTNFTLTQSTANSSTENITLVNLPANPSVFNTSVTGTLSEPSTINSISNTAQTKPLANLNLIVAANNSNSIPRGILNKPTSVPPTNSGLTVSRTVTNTNSSNSQAQMISPSKVTTLSLDTMKTFGSIPNTPLSKILQSAASTASIPKFPVITKPVIEIGAQPVPVSIHQASQSNLYMSNTTQLVLQSQNLPEQISTKPIQPKTLVFTPSNPVVIPNSPVTSVVGTKQPAMVQTPVTKLNPFLNSIQLQPRSTSTADAPTYIFRPIQPSNFNTNLKNSEFLVTFDSFASPKPSTSTSAIQNQSISLPLKRNWGEIDEDDDDDDDDDDPFFATCNDENYDKEYLEQQRMEIARSESNILQKEREINNLKKKIQSLKKRLSSVKNPSDTKTDEQLIEEILSKYIDSDGVQFFIGQMKVSGKTYTQFRWSEEDKLFALGLLYKNPVEYNVLFQKYVLPSDKTLNKFVNRVKKAEMQDTRGTSSR